MYGYGFTSDNYTFAATGVFSNTYSLNFDGVDEYVNCGNVTGLISKTNISFSCWVKFGATGASERILGRHASNSQLIMMLKGTDNIISFRPKDVLKSQKATTPLSSGVWYHIAVTFDGTQGTASDRVKIYIDGSDDTGTMSGTVDGVTSSTTNDFHLANNYTGGNELQGNLDEVRIYDYTLSSTDVSNIYNSGTPKEDDLSTPAIHYWRMGDGSDTISTINDVGTTGGNDGTPTNMESGDIVADVP